MTNKKNEERTYSRRNASYWKTEQALNSIERFVSVYWKKNFRSPSYREIMEGLNEKSTSGIYRAVNILEQKGRIVNREDDWGSSSRQIVPIWVIEAIKDYSKANN